MAWPVGSAGMYGPTPIRCVGAIMLDEEGRLLLVLRGHPPGAGRWSLPGGPVKPDESDWVAVRRQVQQQTGLQVVMGPRVGRVAWPAVDATSWYDITAYRCTVVGGSLHPGDDADQVQWVAASQLPGLPVSVGLVSTLQGWGIFDVSP